MLDLQFGGIHQLQLHGTLLF